MSQFGPLNRILIPVLRPSSFPVGPVTAVPDFAIQQHSIFYGCNYGKTFSYSCHAAACLPACLYTSQVFSSSSSIMENAIWRMAAGQLGRRRGRSVMWQSRSTRQNLGGRRSTLVFLPLHGSFFLRSVVGCAQLKPHRQRERTLLTTDGERTPRVE